MSKFPRKLLAVASAVTLAVFSKWAPQGPIWPYLGYSLAAALWFAWLLSTSKATQFLRVAYDSLGFARIPVGGLATALFCLGVYFWASHLPAEVKRLAFTGGVATDRYGPPRASVEGIAGRAAPHAADPLVFQVIDPAAVETTGAASPEVDALRRELGDLRREIAVLREGRNEIQPEPAPTRVNQAIPVATPANLRMVPAVAEEPVSLSLNLTPNRSCADWGVALSPLTSEERTLLTTIPRYNAEAKGLLERLIRGETANTVRGIENWRARVSNALDNTFSPLAGVDFKNTKTQDAFLDTIPVNLKANLSEAAVRQIGETISGLSCLAAISPNLANRPQ